MLNKPSQPLNWPLRQLKSILELRPLCDRRNRLPSERLPRKIRCPNGRLLLKTRRKENCSVRRRIWLRVNRKFDETKLWRRPSDNWRRASSRRLTRSWNNENSWSSRWPRRLRQKPLRLTVRSNQPIRPRTVKPVKRLDSNPWDRIRLPRLWLMRPVNLLKLNG